MIICGLSSGQTNLHPPIWGHGRQLDDQHRHPNINIREIIWLGNQLQFLITIFDDNFSGTYLQLVTCDI